MLSDLRRTFVHRSAWGSFTEWTIVVLAGDGETLSFGGMEFYTLVRRPLDPGRAVGRYRVKTILAPRDARQSILTPLSTAARSSFPTRNGVRMWKGRKPMHRMVQRSGAYAEAIRAAAYCWLYPLSPQKAAEKTGVDLKLPIFGVVISFPDSGSGQSVRYRFNTVAERFEMA